MSPDLTVETTNDKSLKPDFIDLPFTFCVKLQFFWDEWKPSELFHSIAFPKTFPKGLVRVFLWNQITSSKKLLRDCIQTKVGD